MARGASASRRKGQAVRTTEEDFEDDESRPAHAWEQQHKAQHREKDFTPIIPEQAVRTAEDCDLEDDEARPAHVWKRQQAELLAQQKAQWLRDERFDELEEGV